MRKGNFHLLLPPKDRSEYHRIQVVGSEVASFTGDINAAYAKFYEVCKERPGDHICISANGIVRAARTRDGRFL